MVGFGQSSLNNAQKNPCCCYRKNAEFHPQLRPAILLEKFPIAFDRFPMAFNRQKAPLVDEWAFVPATDIFLVVGEARFPPLG